MEPAPFALSGTIQKQPENTFDGPHVFISDAPGIAQPRWAGSI
jgi:hypothetical protein